jgi:hypothetical protein
MEMKSNKENNEGIINSFCNIYLSFFVKSMRNGPKQAIKFWGPTEIIGEIVSKNSTPDSHQITISVFNFPV